MFKSKAVIASIVIIIYLGVFSVFYFWSAPIEYLEELTRANAFWSPFAFTLSAFLAVVFAPLTIIPIIPVASILFGPFWAGLYTIIGWFLGSVVDFILAREFGKPLLRKLVSLESLERYESYIPKKMEFWWVVLLRTIVQVDLLSYALGLYSRISLWKYSLATFIGMAPMAFIISYAGEALLMRNFTALIIFALLFIVLFLVLSYFYYKKGGVKDDIKEEVEIEQGHV